MGIIQKREKAEELFNKYYDILFTSDFRDQEAKICAIEACKTAISACDYNNVESHNTDWYMGVIEEIKKIN